MREQRETNPRPKDTAAMKTTTSTAEAPKARCPECRSDDVALVVVPNAAKPKEPEFYCECFACGHQWDAT